MVKKFPKKKILIYASIFLLVVIGIGLIVGTAEAVSTSGKGTGGGAIVGAAVRGITDAAIGVLIFAGLLYGLSLLLYALLIIASSIFNFIYEINIFFNPITDPVVIEIWGVTRDIANGIFILVVLWIAFTIIFNFEQLGGRKLLVKVIVVALLVNFSLAFVGAVFGFANQLALPFRNATTEKGDVAGVIMENAKIQTSLETLNSEFFAALKQKISALSSSGSSSASPTALEDEFDPSFAQYLGIKEAEANPLLLFGLAGLGRLLLTIVNIFAALTVVEGAFDIGNLLFGDGSATFGVIPDALIGFILNKGIIIIFLALTVFAFITAGIVLIGRVIAMFFLAALAPIAFLAAALPSAAAQGVFSSWLKNLVKWAFFAPAFYFLLYLSLRVLTSLSSGRLAFWSETVGVDKTPALQQDIFALFNLTVFLAFLWASIIVSRKMGITVADGFVNWGQKWMKAGLWYPPAAAGRAGLGVLRRLGAQTSRLERYFPRTPLMPTPVRKAFQRFGVYEKEAAAEWRKRVQPLSSADLQRRYSLPLVTSTERAAILEELSSRGDIEIEPGVDPTQWGPTQIRQGIGYLRNMGKNIIEVLRARPDLATPEFIPGATERAGREGITPEEAAIRIVAEGIRPAHIQKMERQAIITAGNEIGTPVEQVKQQVRRAFWRSPNFQPEHLGQMVRTDPRMSEAMIRELETILADPAVAQAEKDRLRARFEPYLTGALAQGLIRLPRQWEGGGPTAGRSPGVGGPVARGGGIPTSGGTPAVEEQAVAAALGGGSAFGGGGEQPQRGGSAAPSQTPPQPGPQSSPTTAQPSPQVGGRPFRPVAGGAPTRAEETALEATEKAREELQTPSPGIQTPAPAEETAPRAGGGAAPAGGSSAPPAAAPASSPGGTGGPGGPVTELGKAAQTPEGAAKRAAGAAARAGVPPPQEEAIPLAKPTPEVVGKQSSETAFEQRSGRIREMASRMGASERDIGWMTNITEKDFRPHFLLPLLDKTSRQPAQQKNVEDLKNILNIEEIPVRVGQDVKGLKDFEVGVTRGAGRYNVIEEVLEPGYRDKTTGYVLRKPKVAIRLQG